MAAPLQHPRLAPQQAPLQPLPLLARRQQQVVLGAQHEDALLHVRQRGLGRLGALAQQLHAVRQGLLRQGHGQLPEGAAHGAQAGRELGRLRREGAPRVHRGRGQAEGVAEHGGEPEREGFVKRVRQAGQERPRVGPD